MDRGISVDAVGYLAQITIVCRVERVHQVRMRCENGAKTWFSTMTNEVGVVKKLVESMAGVWC